MTERHGPGLKTDHQWRNHRKRSSGEGDLRQLEFYGHSVVWLTDYQCRVDGRFDFYPTNRRYHDIVTGKRGTYKNPEEVLK
jgi:hypothetical protein